MDTPFVETLLVLPDCVATLWSARGGVWLRLRHLGRAALIAKSGSAAFVWFFYHRNQQDTKDYN